jgi:prevent-host-death family protein
MGDIIENLYEARSKLSSLVERAAKGEEIVIAKNGEPMARLVRYESAKGRRVPGCGKGKIWIADDFDARSPTTSSPRSKSRSSLLLSAHVFPRWSQDNRSLNQRARDDIGAGDSVCVTLASCGAIISSPSGVMPALDAGIHRAAAPWIAGSSPAMTTLETGHCVAGMADSGPQKYPPCLYNVLLFQVFFDSSPTLAPPGCGQ